MWHSVPHSSGSPLHTHTAAARKIAEVTTDGRVRDSEVVWYVGYPRLFWPGFTCTPDESDSGQSRQTR